MINRPAPTPGGGPPYFPEDSMNHNWTPLKRRTLGETLTPRERLWRAQMLLSRATTRERDEAEAALVIAQRGLTVYRAQRDAAAEARVDAALTAITEAHRG